MTYPSPERQQRQLCRSDTILTRTGKKKLRKWMGDVVGLVGLVLFISEAAVVHSDDDVDSKSCALPQ